MTAPQRAARAVPRPGGPALQPVRGTVVSFEPSVLVDDAWTQPRLVVAGVGNSDRPMDFMTNFQRDVDALGGAIVGQPVKVSFFADGWPICEGVIVNGAKT